jgi:hypothetical protein
VPTLNLANAKKDKNGKAKTPRKNNLDKDKVMLKSNIDEQHYNEIITGEIPSSRNNMVTPPRDVSPNIRRQNKMFNDED